MDGKVELYLFAGPPDNSSSAVLFLPVISPGKSDTIYDSEGAFSRPGGGGIYVSFVLMTYKYDTFG